jgi:hypothetical protein
MRAIVTLKFPRNSYHNPKQKRVGCCPLSSTCTDVTGEHHCYEETGSNMSEITIKAQSKAKSVGDGKAI